MSIRVSEHVLSLDENILAVSLFTRQFHMVEEAARPSFDSKFRISPSVRESAPSYGATVYGITKLLQDTFGRVEKITVDHEDVKLMLLALKDDGGFLGIVLTKTVNSDYLTLKITTLLEETPSEIDT